LLLPCCSPRSQGSQLGQGIPHQLSASLPSMVGPFGGQRGTSLRSTEPQVAGLIEDREMGAARRYAVRLLANHWHATRSEQAGSGLQDNCQSSVLYGPVRSGQVRLGGVSVQCGLVRCSKAWWNDRQNDHEASGEGALRPARMRARPEGQSGLPDRRTGETWFARGPSGRAASPGVKVPTRASVRVTSGAYRSDLHLCRSTRTVRDEDKAL
jgi:hypothetical protein